MALTDGRLAYLEVAEDTATPTYEKVGKRMDLSLSLNRNEIAAPHADDNGWTEFMMGRKDATIDGTVRYDGSDTGQNTLIDSYFNEKEIMVKFGFVKEMGEPEYSAKGFITACNPTPPEEGPVDMTFTIRINGAVTQDEQA